ncbi:hypothetical protein ACYSNW_12435 [Enterococcus sp. LJL99]
MYLISGTLYIIAGILTFVAALIWDYFNYSLYLPLVAASFLFLGIGIYFYFLEYNKKNK